MALVDVSRQTETLQAFHITSSQDMYDALAYISQGHWGGHLNCTPGATQQWTMGITSPTSNVSQSANVGDWIIIKNSAEAEVCTNAQFQAMYSTG